MMTLKRKILFPTLISLGLLMSTNVFAGDPPPVGGDPTEKPGGGTPIGGSAPIGSGLIMVLGFGLAYGTKKAFDYKSEEE